MTLSRCSLISTHMQAAIVTLQVSNSCLNQLPFDPQVNLPHIISGAPVALIAAGRGILMKVKKSRERRGENALFSSLPESPARHQQELNASGKWKHHGYLLQAGNLSLSGLSETLTSLPTIPLCYGTITVTVFQLLVGLTLLRN